MNERLFQLLSELNTEAPKVRYDYKDLFDADLDTIPIPFFGHLHKAKVITIGLNPSDGEIRGRGWHQPIGSALIYERLINYFNNPKYMRHRWFETWENALREICVSYTDGTAAHVDICPWATRPMSNHPDHNQFTNLVYQSLPWFWRCLQAAENMHLVLMAGAVNKKYYLNEFISRSPGPDGAIGNTLNGNVSRNGKAFVNCHTLHIFGREIPVFFCSVSPSARNSAMLPVRVQEHKECIVSYLE